MALVGLAVVALRPEIGWLGCAVPPEACVAATDSAAVALEPTISEPARAA